MEGIKTEHQEPGRDEKIKQLKAKLQSILSFSVNMETLSHIGVSMEEMFENTVSIITEAREIYAKEHSEISDVHKIEDSALNEFGFTDVPGILDQLNEIKNIIEKEIPELIKGATVETITPTEDNEKNHKKIPTGSGNGFHEKETRPRLTMLLYTLIKKCHVSIDQMTMKEGEASKDTMRTEPYISVFIPSLNRFVIVCDEYGNRTDIFDTLKLDVSKEISENLKYIDGLSKEQKDEYGKKYPGSHIKLNSSDKWDKKIYYYLNNPLSQEADEKIMIGPNDIELLPRTDSSGYYIDKKTQEKWGSAKSLMKEILGHVGFYSNPDMQKILLKLESKKIMFSTHPGKGYKFSKFEKAVKEDANLSVFLRRIKDDGFYKDENGKLWGSIEALSRKISGSINTLRRNEHLKKILSGLETKKITSINNIVNGYDLAEVEEAAKKDPNLEYYFRRAGESKFYKEEESGNEYGSIKSIADRITGKNKSILPRNKNFIEMFKNLETKKILAGRSVINAYNFSEVLEFMKKNDALKKYLREDIK